MRDTDDMHLMKPRAHSNLGQDQSKDPLEEKKIAYQSSTPSSQI